MIYGMNEFDIKAADWDNNPMHLERSRAIAGEIKKIVPLNNKMRALEYGSGTGITSFLLRDNLKEIVLMDNSREMLKVTNEKIRAAGVKNLKTLYLNLETDEYKGGKFDLIFTVLVLHHVTDTQKIIRKLAQLMNPSGYLVIADLREEDGSFHDSSFHGHNGFNTETLSAIIGKEGFSINSQKTCFVIKRQVSESETKDFEVFLLEAQKISE